MGILATMPINKNKCVVVSDDKDLKSIPSVSPQYRRAARDQRGRCSRFFLTQVLCGDQSDGYPGVKAWVRKRRKDTASISLGCRTGFHQS